MGLGLGWGWGLTVGVRVRGRVGGRVRSGSLVGQGLGWGIAARPAPAQIGQSGSASSAAVGGRCGCAPHAADQCSTPALLPLPELHTKSRATSTASGRLLTPRVAPPAPPPPPLAPPPPPLAPPPPPLAPPLAPPPPAACRCGRSAMCSASCSSSSSSISSSSVYQIPNTEHMAYRLVRTLVYKRELRFEQGT